MKTYHFRQMWLLFLGFFLVILQMILFHPFTVYIWYVIYNVAFTYFYNWPFSFLFCHSFYPRYFWEKVRYLVKIWVIFLCMMFFLNSTVLYRLQPSSLTVSSSSFCMHSGTFLCISFLCEMYYTVFYMYLIYNIYCMLYCIIKKNFGQGFRIWKNTRRFFFLSLKLISHLKNCFWLVKHKE